MAVLTASLTRLRADFNTAFPGRDKASDGWIGDAAHQASTSGHNPDDTAGSRAEYSDADSKAEVRALDVDKDLRSPHGVTMANVVGAILATPADRIRLAYIIFNRRIYRKRNGWVSEAYSGDNAHTEHGHFSGDPAYDEDVRPFSSVLALAATPLGGGMALETSTSINEPGAGGTNAWDTPPTEWDAPLSPGTIPLGVILGGLSRRGYMAYRGLVYISNTVKELAARPVATIPQAAMDLLRQDLVAAVGTTLNTTVQEKIGQVFTASLDAWSQSGAFKAAVRAANLAATDDDPST